MPSFIEIVQLIVTGIAYYLIVYVTVYVATKAYYKAKPTQNINLNILPSAGKREDNGINQ